MSGIGLMNWSRYTKNYRDCVPSSSLSHVPKTWVINSSGGREIQRRTQSRAFTVKQVIWVRSTIVPVWSKNTISMIEQQRWRIKNMEFCVSSTPGYINHEDCMSEIQWMFHFSRNKQPLEGKGSFHTMLNVCWYIWFVPQCPCGTKVKHLLFFWGGGGGFNKAPKQACPLLPVIASAPCSPLYPRTPSLLSTLSIIGVDIHQVKWGGARLHSINILCSPPTSAVTRRNISNDRWVCWCAAGLTHIAQPPQYSPLNTEKKSRQTNTQARVICTNRLFITNPGRDCGGYQSDCNDRDRNIQWEEGGKKDNTVRWKCVGSYVKLKMRPFVTGGGKKPCYPRSWA